MELIDIRQVLTQILGFLLMVWILRRYAWVNAEVLGQVTERAAQRVGIGQHVDVAKPDRALGGNLQRGDASHQRRFAGPVRPQQPKHAARYLERYAVERARAIWIDVCQVFDAQHAMSPSNLLSWSVMGSDAK